MKKYLAELIGTFVLVLTACGAAALSGGYTGYLGVTGIALVFGFIYIAMAYSIGTVSGAHFNPAISVGMLASGRMSWIDFMGYVVAQILGGIAGAFTYFGLAKSFDQDMLAQYSTYGFDLTNPFTNGYGDLSSFVKINMWGALLVEVILSFILVVTFLGVTAKRQFKTIAGFVIGIAMCAVHFFGTLLTGTGVNPARSFGPALVKAVTGDVTALSQVWVFIAGPLIGALLAAAVMIVMGHKQDINPAKGIETEETQTEEQKDAIQTKQEAGKEVEQVVEKVLEHDKKVKEASDL